MHWIAAPGATRRRVFAFTALTLLLACVDVWLIGDERDAQRRVDAQAETARSRTPAGSGPVALVGSDVARGPCRGEPQTTGEFHDGHQKILNDGLVPSARRKRISTKAAVQNAAVIDGGTNETVVLVFLTQTTLSRSQPTPVVTGKRVEVTMTMTSAELGCGLAAS